MFSSEAKVKDYYPDAVAEMAPGGIWTIWNNESRVRRLIGMGKSEQSAWMDALLEIEHFGH